MSGVFMITINAVKIVSIDESKEGFFAGLRYGDLIAEYNDIAIESPSHFFDLMEGSSALSAVSIIKVSGGKLIQLSAAGGDLGVSVSQPKETSVESDELLHANRIANLDIQNRYELTSKMLSSKNEAVKRKAFENSPEGIALMPVTTLKDFPGTQTVRSLGIVGAQCVHGMHLFKDIFADVRDIVGGRSKAIENTMQDARETAVFEMQLKAHSLGANAIVDIHFTFNDGGGRMAACFATGTAVVVE